MGVVEQLMDQRLRKKPSDEDDDHNLFISRLPSSKLENLREEEEEEEEVKNDDLMKKNEEPCSSPAVDDDQGNKDGTESSSSSSRNDDEIILRELREVKKQNFITHCLLSAMIVLTLTWQLSEVSIIFQLKDRITHPFRSISQFLGLNKATQAVPLLNELPGFDLQNNHQDDDHHH